MMGEADTEIVKPSEPARAAARVELADKERRARRWNRIKAIGRWSLFVLGVGALIWLVHDAGPDVVWGTLVRAGVFMPFVIACEVGFASMDVVSLRLLYGRQAHKAPPSVWLRSALMAYGIMIVLPAGRAGGEVMRAAHLAPYIGGPRAAAGATFLQGVTLWGNTLISIPCYAAVVLESSAGAPLAIAVLVNGVLTAIGGSLLLFGARFSTIGGWFGRRFKALASYGVRFDNSLREMPAVPALPIVASFAARVFQAIQYGIILLAVGGTLTMTSGFVAQAIHLVGAGLGDLVPNQAGITEFTYRIFRADVGFKDSAAQAIAIALTHRICQFTLAGSSLAIGSLWRPGAAPEPVATSRSELAG